MTSITRESDHLVVLSVVFKADGALLDGVFAAQFRQLDLAFLELFEHFYALLLFSFDADLVNVRNHLVVAGIYLVRESDRLLIVHYGT